MTHLLTVGSGWARGANGASQTLGREGRVRGRERQPGTRCPAGSLGRPHPGALGVSFHGPQNALSPQGPSVDREVPADAQPTQLNMGPGTTLTHGPSVPECMGSLHPSPSQPQGACHQHPLTRPPSFPGAPSGPFSPTSPCGIQKTGHLREALQDLLCQHSVLPEWAPGGAQSLAKRGLLWSQGG